ncbi:MAG: TIGR00730 family Rossman fold protein, partial [Alphaproteobacteria bacterium]|nr:TIGR00730 family Rossman fold protein [Alphaproteobacteria bacterium]
ICADAVLEAGGKAIGVIPKHLDDLEVGHRGVTELIVCRNMHERKERMFDLSDAFAVLPGGYGTLDEAFEMITWRQLRLHDKPVVFVDIDGYWKPLRQLLDHIIAEGYARPETRRLYSVVERVEDVFKLLARAPAPAVEPKSELI